MLYTQNKYELMNLFNSDHNSEVSCYRIPSIITASNGDLIVAIDERVPSCGDLKWNDDINIVMRKSLDNGNTWTQIRTIVDYPKGKSASDPSMIFDEVTNTIFLFFNFMNHIDEKDKYYLKYISSSDYGKSWSDPVDITNQISKKNWSNDFKFITSGRGFQAKDGTLLHCLVNLQNGTHVFGSNDNGKTWFISKTPVIPGDESKIIELSDGSWMVNSRVNNSGYRYSHISTDFGNTWNSKKEIDLIDPGSNASLITYNYNTKNFLLLSNINDKKERKELVIRYSLDEGNSWSAPKIIYRMEAAYSSMTVLSNGDIGLFFEADNYRNNFFTRIKLDKILEF